MIRDLPGEWDKGRLPVCGPSFGASHVTRDTRENRRHLSPVSPEGVWNSGSFGSLVLGMSQGTVIVQEAGRGREGCQGRGGGGGRGPGERVTTQTFWGLTTPQFCFTVHYILGHKPLPSEIRLSPCKPNGMPLRLFPESIS